MPALSLDEELATYEVALVENALIDGHPPPGKHRLGNRNSKSALRVAADRLGIDAQTLRQRVGTPGFPGATIKKRFGLEVDWSVYREPKPAPPPAPEPLKAFEPPADPLIVRRLRDENAQLRAALKESERRAVEAEDIRSGVLRLTSEPLAPRLIMPGRDEFARSGRTVILHLSDIQYGETILSEEMDGLNRYDSEIAKVRLGRFFSKASDLMTKHWKGDPPDEIVLCLGGDLISGSLHPELEQTDFPTVPETVREVGEHIAGGIIMLRNEVKRPIRVMQVPGNHGRFTDKPQSKRRAASSLDLLAGDFCEAVVRGAKAKDVIFYKTQSPDAYFTVYSAHVLLTHGDTMGYRGGGVGFIGPMATIIKGHRKLVDTAWRSGKPVHFVLTGHFHTTGKTPFGWANGSVAGYNEYARDLRADPEPARQNLLVVHPHHGVIQEMPLYLGHPDEGSLYMGPATLVRPQWGEA
jgi:hypothetical protein